MLSILLSQRRSGGIKELGVERRVLYLFELPVETDLLVLALLVTFLLSEFHLRTLILRFLWRFFNMIAMSTPKDAKKK